MSCQVTEKSVSSNKNYNKSPTEDKLNEFNMK